MLQLNARRAAQFAGRNERRLPVRGVHLRTQFLGGARGLERGRRVAKLSQAPPVQGVVVAARGGKRGPDPRQNGIRVHRQTHVGRGLAEEGLVDELIEDDAPVDDSLEQLFR